MENMNLNLAAICRKTNALGPGNRAVVWVQGCPFRCNGCIAPEWIPMHSVWKIKPETLADELLRNQDITGITISGGEPILQASALSKFLHIIKSMRDLDIILFSGYYYANLLAFPQGSPVWQLLQVIDVLIDGPYDEKKNDNRGLRGSSNQGIHHLTDRLRDYNFRDGPRQTEIQIHDGEMLFVGIPPKGVISGISKAMTKPVGISPRDEHYEWT